VRGCGEIKQPSGSEMKKWRQGRKKMYYTENVVGGTRKKKEKGRRI
jgi:hypothetical protein